MARMGRKRKEIDQSTYSGRVAARLRSLRERAGKSVPEMARAVGVSQFTWYGWESAKFSLDLNRAPKIASVLGVSPRTLFPTE